MKAIKWIGLVLVVLGFVLALGTAGASDVDAICFDMAIIRSFIALAMICGGFLTIYLIEKK